MRNSKPIWTLRRDVQPPPGIELRYLGPPARSLDTTPTEPLWGWIRMAQKWHRLRAPVTRVTCLPVALKDGHLLTSSFSVPFSSTTRMPDRGSQYSDTSANE